MQSTKAGGTPAARRQSPAALAASVTSDSLASAYASEIIPARWRNFPTGIPKAASISSDGIVLEPYATPENRRRADVGRLDMNDVRPHWALALCAIEVNTASQAGLSSVSRMTFYVPVICETSNGAGSAVRRPCGSLESPCKTRRQFQKMLARNDGDVLRFCPLS